MSSGLRGGRDSAPDLVRTHPSRPRTSQKEGTRRHRRKAAGRCRRSRGTARMRRAASGGLAHIAAHSADARERARRGSPDRSEEHKSELQSLMRNSYAVLCLKQKKQIHHSMINMYLHYAMINE